MVIGVINGSITASLEFSHPIGGIESISLNIDEKNIALNVEFLVEVSRYIYSRHNLMLCYSVTIKNMTTTGLAKMCIYFFTT